jgi:PST family polysaccharide transporter
LLVASGESLAVLLLGEPWRPAGVGLTAMAGFGLGQAMNAVTAEALKGTGMSRRLNRLTGVGVFSGIGLLLVLVPFGLFGVGLAMSGASLAVGLTGLWSVRDVVGVSFPELSGRLLPPLVAAAVAAAMVAVLERTVIRAVTWPLPIGLGLVLAEALLLGLLYVGALRVIAPAVGSAVIGAIAGVVRR